MKPFCLLSFVALAAALPAAAEAPAVAQAMALAREAAAAADAKDYAVCLAKMEAAVALRPDFPRMLFSLAAAHAANDHPEQAVAALERLAALGTHSPVGTAGEFAALGAREDFKAVVKRLAANLQPRGAGEIAFTLRDVTGLIEGIAWREKTGEFYFGDTNGRAVWMRSPDGTLRRFTSEDAGLLGVLGLAIDDGGGALWAATSAVPAMRGFTPAQDGTAALAEIDLETGAVRRAIPVPRKPGDRESHVLGDLTLGPDGSVFVTDSGGPIVWRLAPGAAALEPFVESAEFLSLQGVVVARGGGALIVADHANGLLRIDLSNRGVRRIESPPDTTLIGLDGLALAPNGDVLAIQNGLRPNRVLRLVLDSSAEVVTSVAIVESAHLTMAAPSLGCIATGGDFFFIGNAGWARFENTDGRPTEPRSVPVFRTRLGGEKPRR